MYLYMIYLQMIYPTCSKFLLKTHPVYTFSSRGHSAEDIWRCALAHVFF